MTHLTGEITIMYDMCFGTSQVIVHASSSPKFVRVLLLALARVAAAATKQPVSAYMKRVLAPSYVTVQQRQLLQRVYEDAD